MISLLGTVAKESGIKAQEIFWEMPLIVVYAWEHYSYRVNGIDTKSIYEDNNMGIAGSGGAMLDALSKMY